eukprot:TRINITY_DN58428_c0_g1_i1.p1 TRINITY_DN58428_c0_g1~~TRINITY_DN58428_c0_g1_i1.p1  ORF type:complete len:392 (-),score=62.76 TRINITY_DN58428_c0_g1_i1:81-1256(-)
MLPVSKKLLGLLIAGAIVSTLLCLYVLSSPYADLASERASDTSCLADVSAPLGNISAAAVMHSVSAAPANENTTPMYNALAALGARLGRPQRVALIVVGAPRTFVQTGVATSLARHAVLGLGGFGMDVVDVHFHLTVGGADQNGSLLTAARFPELDRAVLSRTREYFGDTVKQWVEYPDATCSGIPALQHRACCNLPSLDIKRMRAWLQFAWIGEAFAAVQRYEVEHNIAYDWYVRIRPDLGCFEPLPAVRNLSPERYYLMTKEKSLVDFLYIVPRRLSEQFFRQQMQFYFDDACTNQKGKFVLSPEKGIHQHRPALPWFVIPAACAVVRSPATAECSRMMKANKTFSPMDMDGSLFRANLSFVRACRQLVVRGYFAGTNHLTTDFVLKDR